MEVLANNVTELRDAVATYCAKYHIAPAFAICDVFDIKDPQHWAIRSQEFPGSRLLSINGDPSDPWLLAL